MATTKVRSGPALQQTLQSVDRTTSRLVRLPSVAPAEHPFFAIDSALLRSVFPASDIESLSVLSEESSREHAGQPDESALTFPDLEPSGPTDKPAIPIPAIRRLPNAQDSSDSDKLDAGAKEAAQPISRLPVVKSGTQPLERIPAPAVPRQNDPPRQGRPFRSDSPSSFSLQGTDNRQTTRPLITPIAQETNLDANEGDWWASLVTDRLFAESEIRRLDLATLMQETILHSEHVQALSLQPQIRETEIAQADAAFDPAAFIESRWVDTSDPVGNLLTTGGPPRLSREEWSSVIGFRRKSQTGGELEIAQRLLEEDNNSVFFVPANQATSRLTLSLNQPLLRGGGRAFNQSFTLLAMHDTQVARDRFQRELLSQVLRVMSEYWELYYQRAVYLQQEAALRKARDIQKHIQARQSFDSLTSQLHRVEATVAIREAQLARAKAGVQNAQSRLRALSNSPLLGSIEAELLPVDPPAQEKLTLPVEEARQLALANRAEVDEALTRIHAAGVQVGIAKNEMLPSLGLVLEMYLSGLEGNFDLARSVGEQFSEGAPSYTVGLAFEMPLYRRKATAQYRQHLLELRQAEHLFRDTVAKLSSEVEIELRETDTTWQELEARLKSAEATRKEVDYLTARLEHVPNEDHLTVSLHLEALLDAIDRLVRDESELANAQRNYAVAIAEFHRATGMLLQVETGRPRAITEGQ